MEALSAADIRRYPAPAGASPDWTIPQRWSEYTKAEHAIWNRLFERQVEQLQDRAVPAFNAGVTVGSEIVAVNDIAYDSDKLKDAIKDAKGTKTPIQLLIKRGDIYRQVAIDYHGGLRYPHLERMPGTPALLDDILAARK